MAQVTVFGGRKFEHLLLDIDGPVMTVLINNPDNMNALTIGENGDLNEGSYPELAHLFGVFAEKHNPHADRKPIRVIVISGEKKEVRPGTWKRAFCIGGSPQQIVSQLVKMKSWERERFMQQAFDVIEHMLETPQMIIAAVSGWCAGAGLAISAASDLRFGAPGAKVAGLFNQMGFPATDMFALTAMTDLIGPQAAMWLLTGTKDHFLTGERAAELGFFMRECMGPDEDVLERAQAHAHLLCAANSPQSLRVSKVAARGIRGLKTLEALALERAHQVEHIRRGDMDEAFAAFTEKRPPDWSRIQK